MSADWPHVWNRLQRPKGRKGWKCKIVSTGYPAGLVLVRFKRDGRTFIVEKAGLGRA